MYSVFIAVLRESRRASSMPFERYVKSPFIKSASMSPAT
jgi:hypothetical protein